MRPAVSIIVAVYNVEKYINRCLRSLTAQTLENLEIIIVDDGSTDRSGDICDRFAVHDKRITVIHHHGNRGLSVARNTGLDKADGEFIMFVDSDDWVDPDFSRIPYETAIENAADLVFFCHRRIFRHKVLLRTDNACPDGYLDEDDAMKRLYGISGFYVWNKLFHRRLFHSVRFPEGLYYEDNAVTHKLVHAARSIYYTNIVLYNYYYRPGSIVTIKEYRFKRDWYHCRYQQVTDFKQWGCTKTAEDLYNTLAFRWLIEVGFSKKWSKKCVRIVRDIKGYPDHLSRNQRAMLALFRRSPALFNLVCIMMGKRMKDINKAHHFLLRKD